MNTAADNVLRTFKEVVERAIHGQDFQEVPLNSMKFRTIDRSSEIEIENAFARDSLQTAMEEMDLGDVLINDHTDADFDLEDLFYHIRVTGEIDYGQLVDIRVHLESSLDEFNDFLRDHGAEIPEPEPEPEMGDDDEQPAQKRQRVVIDLTA